MEPANLTGKRWTATELRQLPAAERDAILEAMAALVEDEDRNNPDPTDFAAFGEEDRYDEYPCDEARCGSQPRARS